MIRCHCALPATGTVVLRAPDGRQSLVPVCDEHGKPWRQIAAASEGRFKDVFGRVLLRVEVMAT